MASVVLSLSHIILRFIPLNSYGNVVITSVGCHEGRIMNIHISITLRGPRGNVGGLSILLE